MHLCLTARSCQPGRTSALLKWTGAFSPSESRASERALPQHPTPPSPMKSVLLLLALSASWPCWAQGIAQPYPIQPGEKIRILLAPRGASVVADGLPHVGRVEAVASDSVTLLLSGLSSTIRSSIAWADIRQVERATQNRNGEALGLLVGLVGGVAVGYVTAEALSDVPGIGLGGAMIGGFVGLPVGGIAGAHLGNGWERVPHAPTALAVRLTLPLR